MFEIWIIAREFLSLILGKICNCMSGGCCLTGGGTLHHLSLPPRYSVLKSSGYPAHPKVRVLPDWQRNLAPFFFFGFFSFWFFFFFWGFSFWFFFTIGRICWGYFGHWSGPRPDHNRCHEGAAVRPMKWHFYLVSSVTIDDLEFMGLGRYGASFKCGKALPAMYCKTGEQHAT